nr:TonB-dependent receptor [uncultured Bacteroides sp.]
MDQEKNLNQVHVNKILRKSVCAAMILFSWFSLVPMPAVAARNVMITQESNQRVTVKGKVVDEKGEAVIGASIAIKGTSMGTISDINGQFSLNVPSGATLTITCVGFAAQTMKATDKELLITLKEDSKVLDEVVVVGYGTVKRANLAGAVSSVSMKQLEDIPATNLTSVLGGTMPGVTVGDYSGSPLASSTLKIRINGSWNAEAPLYVIDGFIRDADAFNILDPSEVESVSVLKDAQASVYGVRGAGGVVLVKTKQGKEGKAKVNYSGSYGVSTAAKMPEMMSAYEQATMLNDYYTQQRESGVVVADSKFYSEDELQAFKGLNYDWLDMGWKNSSNTRHTLNVSGGTEKVKYFVGGSYMWQDGNFADLSMSRVGVRMGLDVQLTKNLKSSFSLNFTNKNTSSPLNAQDAEADRMSGTFGQLLRSPRWVPAYINGLPVGNAVDPSSGSHPLYIFDSGSYKRSKAADLTAGASFEYTVPGVKGLKANLSFNYGYSSNQGKQLAKSYKLYNFMTSGTNGHIITDDLLAVTDPNYTKTITNKNRIYQSADNGWDYQLNPSISYNRTFGKHDISALLVYEQSQGGSDGLVAYRDNMIIDNYEVMDGFSKNSQFNSSSMSNSARESYIGRINYSYDGKYFVEAATRYEGSTLFSSANRWGLFPSISLGWRISEEKFFKENVSFMDNLKIRASYGRLGNDKATARAWEYSYQTGNGAYFSGSDISLGLYPKNEGLVDNSATWEKTDSYNLGIDSHFLNYFSFNVDAFYKHTFDILDDRKSEFPQTTGITLTPKTNYGIQNAWGGELELGFQKKLNKDWSVQAKGNIAWATNKVIKKYQDPSSVGTWKDEEGRISGGDTGLQCMGIARTQADVDNYIAYLKSHLSDPNAKISVYEKGEEYFKPGMLMFKDVGRVDKIAKGDGTYVDGAPDGKIDDGDSRIINKYSSAPFNFGLSLGVTWKDFRVDAIFSGSFGNNVFYDKPFYGDGSGSRRGAFLSETSNNLKEWAGNYWTESNPNAKYPRLIDGYRDKQSTFWMRDGATLSLRTVNVSYSLPAKMAKYIGIGQTRVFFSGSNLLTIINPFNYKDANISSWVDYPMIRTFNFGLNLSF